MPVLGSEQEVRFDSDTEDLLDLSLMIRRGIPQGYINALEQRLAGTEMALFLALTELRANNLNLDRIDEQMFQELQTPSSR